MPQQPDRKRLKEIFALALEQPREGRGDFLDGVCEDPELRREVESLLAAYEEPRPLLERDEFAAASLFGAAGPQYEGRQVGRYRVVREIGRGGMGTVYLAERSDGEFEQRVALKVVRRSLGDPDLERRFRQERQILAALSHENIARLLDGGVGEDGEPYLVMEYVEGERIDDYCGARDLPQEARLRLFLKVCDAVSYAHRRLVVHRDLKPSNVLVTNTPSVKLLDFGIAKILDDEHAGEQTQTERRAFTPEYAAPEQVTGGPITTSADVYSLGVLLGNLLRAGGGPDDRNGHHQEERHQTGEGDAYTLPTNLPTRPERGAAETRRSSINAELRNIVAMATREEPERRYASAGALAEDVRRYLDGRPVRAQKDAFTYRAGKFVRRNRVVVVAAATVALAVVAGLVVALWQAENARRQRDLAQQERLRAERINTFLREMLSFSNQSVTSVWPVSQRKDVTVNEMLDQVTPRVEAELVDRPDVGAQILATVGSAYASQGRYEAAERNLRAALDVQARLYGEQSEEAAATMNELGVLLYRQTRYDEAAGMLEKAVNFYRAQWRANPAPHRAAQLALATDYFGAVKCYQFEVQTCRSLLEEAWQTSSGANLEPADRWVLTFNKSDYGAILVALGEAREGERLLREAEAEYRRMPGEPRWELGVTLEALGVAALNRKQYDEALRYLLESEQILRHSLGERNGYLTQTLDREAATLYQKGDLPGAEAKARAAQATAESDNVWWAVPTWTLADIVLKAGRAREAADYYRQALAVLERQGRKNFFSIVPIKVGLSRALLAQGLWTEALRVAMEAEAEARRNLGDESPVTKAAADNLLKLNSEGAARGTTSASR